MNKLQRATDGVRQSGWWVFSTNVKIVYQPNSNAKLLLYSVKIFTTGDKSGFCYTYLIIGSIYSHAPILLLSLWLIFYFDTDTVAGKTLKSNVIQLNSIDNSKLLPTTIIFWYGLAIIILVHDEFGVGIKPISDFRLTACSVNHLFSVCQ